MVDAGGGAVGPGAGSDGWRGIRSSEENGTASGNGASEAAGTGGDITGDAEGERLFYEQVVRSGLADRNKRRAT